MTEQPSPISISTDNPSVPNQSPTQPKSDDAKSDDAKSDNAKAEFNRYLFRVIESPNYQAIKEYNAYTIASGMRLVSQIYPGIKLHSPASISRKRKLNSKPVDISRSPDILVLLNRNY